MSELNPAVVLAALNDMLEPMTTHRSTHLSIMRKRVEKLRDHVAEYVDPEKCGFVDGWLTCDLDPGHDGLHEDRWIGGRKTDGD